MPTMHYGTVMEVSYFGVKVKGHGDGNSTLTVDTYTVLDVSHQVKSFVISVVVVDYSVSQKKSPLRFSENFSQAVGNSSTKFYMPARRSNRR